MVNVGDFIERQLPIEFEILIALRNVISVVTIGGKFLHRLMAGFLMIAIENAPGASTGDVLQTSVRHPQPTAVPEARVKVSISSQFRRDPTAAHAMFVFL